MKDAFHKNSIQKKTKMPIIKSGTIEFGSIIVTRVKEEYYILEKGQTILDT